MKKFKIIFLANNIRQNFIINNILKNICFKNCKIDIFYLNQKKRNKFFINILLKIIFYVEKKFLFKNENIVSKYNYKIKKNINKKKFLNILNSNLKSNQVDDCYIADVVINISDYPVSKKLIKISKNGVWEINTNNA